MSEVVIYQAEDGLTGLEVHLDKETVWLTQKQMALLFDKDVRTVNEHLKNIFKESELEESSVIRKFRITASDGKSYNTAHYSLDVIISVGYRVKSIQGTRFRQWATRTLREHIVKGYTINQQRLEEQSEKLIEMQRAVELLSRTLEQQQLVNETGQDVLQVITDYAYALATLDRYDHGTLKVEATSGPAAFMLEYDQAISIVQSMKDDFDGLFGQEKDQGFKSALGAIYQTFDGKDVYPSVEEKAANLLYFVVKNHAFSDGNKRIAAAVFIFFLARNGILYREDGSKRLADNALVALTLLIAESRPEEKDTLVKVVVNLINRSNA
ncbi:MAG: virulence protein RhuM/Fic/DOC family protein [Desulfuromonadales bacterium]|nr:virulence protein RhuM/Fic/DOC family protein [Desulfuromonadales bacterium]MBN2791113.1 virulence protein RhuM/Fic/DOC family protein [Desulfuromonadales bacterium]